jgi:hypothetical protein
LGLVGVPAAAEEGGENGTYPAYYGIYQVSQDHVVGIDRFASDSGETWMLMSNPVCAGQRKSPAMRGFPGFPARGMTEVYLSFPSL